MNMPLALLNRRRRGAVAFSPTALFALAEPGVWYDPSDLTTLFQDTSGTTPVTTPGQSVALALDKSKGLVLGSELVTNGDFSGGLTGFTQTSGNVGTSSVIAGELNVVAGGSGSGGFYQDITVVQGATYLLTVKGRRISGSGSVRFQAYDGAAFTTLIRQFFDITTTGSQNTYSAYVKTTSTTTIRVYLYADTSTTGGFDDVSLKLLPGFHATQATAGSRPIYGIVPVGGRRNLLTFTEQFDNAAWTKNGLNAFGSGSVANTTATTDPLGGNTADYIQENTANTTHGPLINGINLTAVPYTFTVYCKAAQRTWAYVRLAKTTGQGAYFNLSNGTIGTVESGITAAITSVGNGWYRCSVSITADTTAWYPQVNTATGDNQGTYTGNGTSGLYVWGAQLETGSTATAYQRVVSQYDVTEAGVSSLSYLAFDGVDDFLVTPTITPGIDKAQVFAGVRKLSDAATGSITEYSANWNSNAGTFSLSTGGSVTPGPSYSSGSRGNATAATAQFASSTSSFASPITNVVTVTHDIAGDLSAMRVNGAANGTNGTLDKGTGNYLAYPMYIGRRGGTTLPASMQLYSLIVRFGANLSADRITSTETWVNGKTRAY
jgi:hypothetical protein